MTKEERFTKLLGLIEDQLDSDTEIYDLFQYHEKALLELNYKGQYDFNGGFITYLSEMLEVAPKLYTVYQRLGVEFSFTKEEVVRSILLSEIGRIYHLRDFPLWKGKSAEDILTGKSLFVINEAKLSLSSVEFEYVYSNQVADTSLVTADSISFIVNSAHITIFELKDDSGKDENVDIKDLESSNDKDDDVTDVKEDGEELSVNGTDTRPDDNTETEEDFELDDEEEEDFDVLSENGADESSELNDEPEVEKDPAREEAAASFEELFGETPFS